MFMRSPLDQFEMKPLFTMNNILTLSITNFVMYVLIVVGIIYATRILLPMNNNNVKLGLNRWSLVLLAINDTILNMVKSQMGIKGEKYFPLMFSLFNFILIANLISMIPYSFAMSAQMVAIISLSLSLWLGLVMLGFSMHGWGFFALFVPSGTPLPLVPVLVTMEFLSYSSRAMSLGLRTSANILSGHLLMLMLGSLMLNLMSTSMFGFMGGFIPAMGVVAIVMLEFAISMMQAYVFCILFSGYMKDSVYLH
uniref:ATP synthase subunit a n=1 Tax=Pichia sorbitophila (strain ATCC MYA-4447 / BCRC 22081 / CBS 7064 / NBRC 10061 / NRRL Y-12695) TaxID=559304 RepID=C7U012_PICSO|nr:ATP synthase subunit 6 [Millerozyma farinosa]CAY39293.1 ATP synthase, subunit 6 [Millerozyma farinosa]